MRRYALPGAITLVVVLFLIVLAVGMSDAGPSNEVASQVQAGRTPRAPDARMAFQVIGGHSTRTTAAYRGHYLLLNFFAGWCADCAAEVSDVKLASRMLKTRDGEVLGVTWDDASPDALAFMRKYGLTYTAIADANSKLANAYGINGVPESFVIDPQGKVVAARLCPLTNGWVIKTLDRVLGEHKSAVGAQFASCAADPTQTS